ERLLHQRHRAEGVLEPGVDGAGEDEEAEAELADPPEALERRRLDEVEDEPLRHADEAVDGVAEELEAARQGEVGGERGRAILRPVPRTRHPARAPPPDPSWTPPRIAPVKVPG